MAKQLNKRAQNITTTVSAEFYEKAVIKNVSWADAMRTGLAVLFYQIENKVNIWQKISNLAQKIIELTKENHDLRQKIESFNQKKVD